MKKPYIWLAASGLVLVIIAAGMMIYMARFASAVNQTHTAPGSLRPPEHPFHQPDYRHFRSCLPRPPHPTACTKT